MVWWSEFNSVFWLTLSGILIGFCGLTARMCYKSKCKTIDCFGLHIVRDTEAEEKIDEIDLQVHGDDESKDDI
jgi:hypothetical protein